MTTYASGLETTRLAQLAAELHAAGVPCVLDAGLIRRGERDHTVVAVTGTTSTGKTTLLNALIGRPILATGRMPETGTPVFVRRAASDTAEIVLKTAGRIPIPLEWKAIQRYTTVRPDEETGTGERRAIASVELGIRGFDVASYVRIVDLPGLAASLHSDRQAALGQDDADVVVWLTRANPLLPENEQRALRRLIAAKGAGAVIVAMNVNFPRARCERWATDWEAFLAERFAECLARFERLAEEWSIDGVPVFLPLAALPMEQAATEQDFGRAALLEALSGFHPSSAAVTSSRARHLRTALEGTRDVLENAAAGAERFLEQRAAREGYDAERAGARAHVEATARELLWSWLDLYRRSPRENPADGGVYKTSDVFSDSVDALCGEIAPQQDYGASQRYEGSVNVLARESCATLTSDLAGQLQRSLETQRFAYELAPGLDALWEFPSASIGVPAVLTVSEHLSRMASTEEGRRELAAIGGATGVFGILALVLAGPFALLGIPVIRYALIESAREWTKRELISRIKSARYGITAFWQRTCTALYDDMLAGMQDLSVPPDDPGSAPFGVDPTRWCSWIDTVEELLNDPSTSRST